MAQIFFCKGRTDCGRSSGIKLATERVRPIGGHQTRLRLATARDASTINLPLRGRSSAASAPSLNTQPSTLNSARERSLASFTLLELLIVMGIIAVLLVLIAPAFTTIKSGADATSAAYTIKGVLDQARTYAMANNTYSWFVFF